jgi:acyl-homoserine lactone acylase PvdQ
MLRRVLLLAVATLVSAPLWAAELADYRPPDAGKVRIVRDQFGVPHIIARDDHSLFFGAGYAQAEDQLENLAKNYLRASGRAAEFEGSGELAVDHLIRSLRVPQRGDEQYAQLPEESKVQVDGFAEGINAYIREHRQSLPEWIEPVRPADALRFATYVDVQFCIGHCMQDLDRAGVKVAQLERLPAADSLHGSNQFAISPRRSSTGAALLSMDPHLRHSGFYRWYEMHLVGPRMNVLGACFIGSPAVSMGRTAASAWCMTVNAPDLGDVFAFDINPQDAGQYRDLDGWKAFETGEEVYRVSDGARRVERRLPYRRTTLGPVVAEANGKALVIVLPWPEASNRVRQFADMARATSVAQFKEALRPLGLVMFNVVYANTAGEIFYISNGRVPRRDLRISSHDPRPGHEAWARWQGYHSLDEMPQVLNPPAGYLLNTNSGPQNVCPDVAPQPRDFAFAPYLMGQEANSRSRRLAALLAADSQITPEEMMRYATDTHIEAADLWRPKLLAQLRRWLASSAPGATRDRAVIEQVADLLASWDGRTDLDSRGAALFVHIVEDERFSALLERDDPQATVAAVLAHAREFAERFRGVDVPWSEVSRIRRGDIELGIAGCGARGERLAPLVALRPTYGSFRDGKRLCVGGSSYGMIVDFSGGVRAVSCLPFGVSEHPESKHFADQMPLYAQARFKPAWFEPEEIEEHKESDVVLSARGGG